MSLFYISFATNHRGFLGATVVDARNPENALERATELGLNPGGEAAILKIPGRYAREPDVIALHNRLAGKDEIIATGAQRLIDVPAQMRRAFNHECHRVCEDCNR